MAMVTRHDAWAAGESYEAYMGRWSRPIAALFLDWLAMLGSLDWLDLGCGTGALTAAIVRQCEPANVLAIDPSEGFIEKARENVDDTRVEFRVGDAGSLAILPSGSRDTAVAALGPQLHSRSGHCAERDEADRSPGRNRGLLCLGLSRRRDRVYARLLDGGGCARSCGPRSRDDPRGRRGAPRRGDWRRR